MTSLTSDNSIINKCSKCGKEANPYYITSCKKEILCTDCYNEINYPKITDPFKKKCYDLFLNIKHSLDNCCNLLDNQCGYVTTASGVAKERIGDIDKLLEEIRNETLQS